MGNPSPVVSVVTPFYNTERYLAECISSVLAQTYEDFEYVLVNNRSTDSSYEIARQFAERDSRIRLTTNEEFLGQIPNYNRALSLISPGSRYTKVVEADNWIYPRCLEEMVALAEQHPSVGIVSAYALTERRLMLGGVKSDVAVLSGRDAARLNYLGRAYLFGPPTTMLLRSSIVRGRSPYYQESHCIGADLGSSYEVLREWDLGFVHQVLSFRRTGNGGTVGSSRRGFDTMALVRLALAVRHGEHFLTPEEHGQVVERAERYHYERLALGVLRGKGRAFWDFHRQGLADFGRRISYPRLGRHVLRELFWLVGNPVSTAMGLLRSLKGFRPVTTRRGKPAGSLDPVG